jgi:hypothetical protein
MNKRKTLLGAVVLGSVLISIVLMLKITITGNYEGIFLLKGRNGSWLELKDDLFLNEAQRYIIGLDLDKEKQFVSTLFQRHSSGASHLYFEWNENKGEGFIRNYLPGGKQLFTSFSRFIDESGAEVSGLFVGGGLPAATKEAAGAKLNETGMAYYNGARWIHLWCSVNEAISNFSSFMLSYPSSWKFLGSRILHRGKDDLVLKSSHEIVNDNVPLHMDRYAYFKAGETYFILEIMIKNIGTRATTFFYLYGDEPWLGDYGTSAGNVGWAEDGMHKIEGYLNIEKNHYAGFYDYGNDVIGEPHNFTRAANFIEWFGSERPSVYFSNDIFYVPQNNKKTPLSSNARFIGLNWGPRTLEPDQTVTYTIALGMAGHDGTADIPVKPKIDLKNFP